MKMKLVKNFNLAFIISLVIILNLINGHQFNQTPEQVVSQQVATDPASEKNNILNKDSQNSAHVIGSDGGIDGTAIKTSKLDSQETQHVQTEHSKHEDEFEDKTDLSEEEIQAFVAKSEAPEINVSLSKPY